MQFVAFLAGAEWFADIRPQGQPPTGAGRRRHSAAGAAPPQKAWDWSLSLWERAPARECLPKQAACKLWLFWQGLSGLQTFGRRGDLPLERGGADIRPQEQPPTGAWKEAGVHGVSAFWPPLSWAWLLVQF